MADLITEIELRELWQNGRGVIPVFPPGTRFSPSARDFLRDHRLQIETFLSEPSSVVPISPNLPLLPVAFRVQPRGEACTNKIFYTELDIEELHQKGMTCLAVNEQVILTDLAKEKARRLGIDLVRGTAQVAASVADEALLPLVKAAVLARLGGDRVEQSALDTIIRKVLAGLK